MTEPSLSKGPVPPPGWYRDPAHPGRQRWWDGAAWSNQVRLESRGVPVGTSPPAATAAPSFGPRPVQVVRRAAPVASAAPAGFALVPVRTTADGVTLASVARRFAATVIDGFLVTVLAFVLPPLFISDFQNRFWGALYTWSQATAAANGQSVPMSDDLTHLGMVLNYCEIGITVAYGLLALLLWSRTLGQRAVGIAVSPLDHGKDRVTAPAAVSRTLLWALLSVTGSLLWLPQLVSVGMVLWHPKRQSLPDLLARTQVVRR